MRILDAEIRQSIDTFVTSEAELQALLRSSPVAQELARRAVAVESAAKRYASGRPGPNVKTGRLRGSITWEFGEDSFGVYVDIGTNVFYGPFVEFGTSRAPAYPFMRPALEAARA